MLRHIFPSLPRRPLRSSVRIASLITSTPRNFSTSTIRKNSRAKMSDIEVVFTKDAAFPAGPYSQAIKTPSTIFCSGQIPSTPSGEILTRPEHTLGQLTEQCIQNLSAVLTAAGSSLARVVKVNVFITTMDDFAEMNATYEKFFTHKPARSCVAVKELPKGVPVEIECIALV